MTDQRNTLEDDISVHIFTASAAMVGVCVTVIGLFRISNRMKGISTIGDDVLALDAFLFLLSCILAYLALRTRRQQRRYRLEIFADRIFLAGLSVMVIICALLAYELV